MYFVYLWSVVEAIVHADVVSPPLRATGGVQCEALLVHRGPKHALLDHVLNYVPEEIGGRRRRQRREKARETGSDGRES